MNTSTETANDKNTASPSSVDRILEVAEALFAQRGFSAVSMNAIAEQAKVSKANIFHHFSSKEDLYLAVMRTACDATTGKAIAQTEKTSGLVSEALAQFSKDGLRGLLNRDQFPRLILRELLDSQSTHAKDLAEKAFGESFAGFIALIREWQAQGRVRSDIDPAVVAVMLHSSNVIYSMSREILRHLPDVSFADQSDAFSQKMVDVLLRGIEVTAPQSEGSSF